MPQQLLNEAIEEAHRSSPPVRAMALLHIARVLTALDRSEAKRMLDQAIKEVDALPAADRVPAMNDVVSLIATVSPEEAFLRLPSLEHDWGQADWVLRNMLVHGHKAEVIAYLADPLPGFRYPATALHETLGHCREDPDAQRRILRGGMSAMRASAAEHNRGFRPERSQFVRAFVHYWEALPREEAAQFLREYVNWTLRVPDDRSDHKFSSPMGTVRFSSTRQRELFEILGPLRELEPSLAESLIRDHDQLARACSLYPRGFEELLSTGATEVPQPLPTEPIEWDEVHYGWIPVSQWLATTYHVLFNAALNLYATDTSDAIPNQAPREIWPSTQAFRALFHRVGRHEGRAAATRLKRIPDPDLRLFAKIELAAALCGLEALGGTQQAPRPAQQSAEESALTPVDLAAVPIRWKGRGGVKEVRAETATWDAGLRQWSAPRITTTSLYTPEGLLLDMRERHENGSSANIYFDYDRQQNLQTIRRVTNENTATFDCSYDKYGRLVRVASRAMKERQEFSDDLEPFQMSGSFGGIYGSVQFHIGDEGLKVDDAAGISLEYDEKRRPVQVSFFDEKHSPLGTSRRTWSDSGTLAREEFMAAQPVISGIEEDLDDQAFASLQSPWVTLLTYDERGRCKQRETVFSGETVSKVESVYDELGNPVEQRITEPGASDSVHELHYEYVYDEADNWTTRILQTRLPGQADFELTSIDRRQIQYF